MSDNATLVERLKGMAVQARACIPTDYYIHEKVDATFTEVATIVGEAAARIASLEAERDRLREALTGMVDMYVEMVDSGDAGYWDAEKVPQVIAARAALSPTPSGE